MSIEKTELKMLLARNFCEEMEKSQVKARASIKEYKGEARAFLKAEKMLNEQTQKTKQKIMDGKVEADLTDPMQLAKFVVGEMMSLAGEIHNLGNGAITSGIRAEGSVSAWEDAAKLLQDTYEEERRKLEAFRAAMAEHRVRDVGGDLVIEDAVGDNEQRAGGGPPPPRAVGTHPGLTLKALREAGQQAEKEAAAVKKKPKKTAKKNGKTAKKPKEVNATDS